MKAVTLAKWSPLLLVPLAGIALAIAHSRDRYPGYPVDGQVLALIGARIYDPAGDSIIEDADVIVRGREISFVGTLDTVPSGARTLNVDGLTLLPGFIDSHVHMSGIRTRVRDGRRELGWLRYSWRFTRRFPDRRRLLIETGVTSVKSLGDPFPWIVNFGEKTERHELAGPRIFAAGPMFTAPGGHPVAKFRQAGQGDTSFIAQVTRQIVGPSSAEIEVNRISRRVDYVSAVLESRGELQLPKLSVGVLRSIVYTAHRHNLPTLVHVSTLEDVHLALPAGVDGIEHVPIDQVFDSVTLATLRRRRVVVDPTLQAVEQNVGELLRDTESARRARVNVRLLHEAGVVMVVGSDAPGPGITFGVTFHEELRNLVEVGLTPAEAIAAATSVAAEFLGVADRLGTIEPGKLADIIAVGGDPLADIRDASDIYMVIADGQVLYERLGEARRPRGVIAVAGGAFNTH
jgi:enamidase